MNDELPLPDKLVELAILNGVIQERNRIMAILVKYKAAGWIDNGTAHLLAEDINVEGEN